ncbi:FadR family transcriptional regulator [Bacillus sp. BGMRC 2118]|nr:FadR family transcriptional regulator [Bacillus sp. BGMRC 2118]
MIEPVKRLNVTDSIVNQIKDLVLQGKLTIGDRLPPERELMNQFGVGRPSLREALKVLEAQGLIEKTQKGTIITGNHDKFFTDSLMFQLYFSSSTLDDIYETRRFIERELTFMATKRATEDDLYEIEQTIFDMETAIQSENQEAYVSANLHFHDSIAKASKNQVMYHLYQSITSLVEHSQVLAVTVPGIKSDSLFYHKEIFSAIKAGDAQLASERMVSHITSVSKFLLKN